MPTKALTCAGTGDGGMSHSDPALLCGAPSMGRGGGHYLNHSCDEAGDGKSYLLWVLFTGHLTTLWVFSEEIAFASRWKDCWCQSSGGARAEVGRGELCLRESGQHVQRPGSKPGTRCHFIETLQRPKWKLLLQMRKQA